MRASASSRSRSASASRRDGPRLGVRLLEHEIRLPLGLGPQLVRRLLRRHERRAQERLEVAVTGEVGLELLDPVGVLGALAPGVLERPLDLLEQLVDGSAAVAEQAAFQLYVVELDWCDGHGSPLR